MEAHALPPPVLQLCSGNAPMSRGPLMGHVLSVPFLGGCPMPRHERALGHGEQGGPQGCPMPANSHKRSAQTDPSLGRTLVRTGRKTSSELASGVARLYSRPHGPGPAFRAIAPDHCQEALRGAGCGEADASCSLASEGPLLGTVPWGQGCPETRARNFTCFPAFRFRCPSVPPSGET